MLYKNVNTPDNNNKPCPPSLLALLGRSKERMKRKVVIIIVPVYGLRLVPPEADTKMKM